MYKERVVFILFGLLLSFVFAKRLDAKNYQWENISQQQYVENLIDCHKELKQYHWSKTIWPKSNAQPKPSFDEMYSIDDIRLEVENSLLKQGILSEYFNITITKDLLQYDLNRMANNSKDIESLKDIYSLFENNPISIAHCLSRTYVVETKLINSFYWSSGIHQETKLLVKDEIEYLKTHGLKRQSLLAQQNKQTYKVFDENNLSQEKQDSVIELTPDEYINKIQQLQPNKLQENKTFFSYSEVVSESTDQITFNVFSWKKQGLNAWLSNINNFEDTNLPIAIDLYLTKIKGEHTYDKVTIPADTWVVNYQSPGERFGHTAVWTGVEMIVWGGEIGGIELNTGGRYNPTTDSWIEMTGLSAPIARVDHTAIWTGEEMVVWGGRYLFNGYHYLRTGGRYNPNTNAWSATSLTNAPSKRAFHSTVWDGDEMIVWGGYNYNVGSYFNSGGRYDPVLDSWQSMTMTNAPSEREEHTAIWTGTEMIVWGGNNFGWLDSGGRYDPTLDQWQPISTINPPSRRSQHTAIWTGEKMVVWGGSNQSIYYDTGGMYNPSDNTWQSTSTTNTLEGRNQHSTIWTGNEMIVFGGRHNDAFENGARFNPNSNSWSALSLVNASSARSSHSAIWTGTEMIVWGGIADGSLNTGGRYFPESNTWQAVSTTDAPIGRANHSTVWTGVEMIVWGGKNTHYLGGGGRYRPNSDSWLPTSLSNSPTERADHTAIWTGSEMIVWGGRIYENSGYTYFNTGSRYNPMNNSWQVISNNQTPSGRYNHTAIWTGNEMVVWGGKGTEYYNSGGRYNPVTNSWLTTNSIDAPSNRRNHSAIWTGNEMIVWGGYYYDGGSTYFNNGSKYNPTNNSWQEINSTNTPSARDDHSVVWTGNEMIIWGGGPGGAGNMLFTGSRYDPINDNWTATSTVNAPSARLNHSAIWTGNDLIIWGGYYSDGYQDYYKTGGIYDPINNLWHATSIENSPRARQSHSSVWTGTKMIIWGGIPGSSASSSTNTIGIYYPYESDDLIFKNGFD